MQTEQKKHGCPAHKCKQGILKQVQVHIEKQTATI